MKTLYFDTNYLFRIYSGEPGHEEVLRLAESADVIASSWHARAEFSSILLRKRREGNFAPEILIEAAGQFRDDRDAFAIQLLNLTDAVAERLERVLEFAPAATNLRAADALHLACAAEHGFSEIFSNDKRFLDAAPLFGLKGVNVIP